MNVLLFGASGMLGRYVYQLISMSSRNCNVICITRNEFDIGQDCWSKLNTLLKSLTENDVIINCAGIIPNKINQFDFTNYIRINVLFPHKLSEYSKERNVKFIHISTDGVFDGCKGNYNEKDAPSIKTLYGVSKFLGEPEEATVIRTSIIGEEVYEKKSLLEWIRSNKDKQISGFTNHYWNGVTCLTLAKLLSKIIDENLFWKGVKHVFSPNVVTKYDLCMYINGIYNLNIKVLPVEDSCQKNMTLCTCNDKLSFQIDDIFTQLKHQKQYNM